MKYTEKYIINVHDEDYRGILSPSGFLRYLQHTANCHMSADGPSYNELFSSGYSFILSRIKIEFLGIAHGHDSIECSTWAVESGGFIFPRCYEMKIDGVTIARARSSWALVDINTKKFVKNDGALLDYRRDEDLSDIVMPRKFPKPDSLAELGTRKIAYEDIDRNMHMNNTHYADMLCGFIPSFGERELKSLDISYVSEAPLGEVLNVFGNETEHGYYIKTIRSDGRVNTEAYAEFG